MVCAGKNPERNWHRISKLTATVTRLLSRRKRLRAPIHIEMPPNIYHISPIAIRGDTFDCTLIAYAL